METLLESKDELNVIKAKIINTDYVLNLIHTKTVDLQKLEKRYKKLTEKLVERNNEIAILKQKYEEVDARLLEFISKYKPLETEYEKLKISYNTLQESHHAYINRAETKYQHACKEIEDLNKTFDNARKNATSKDKKSEKAKNNKTSPVKNDTEQFEQLKEQYKVLEDKRNADLKNLAQIQLECSKLKQLLEQKNKSHISNSNSDLQSRVEVLQENLKYSKVELEILKLAHESDILQIKEKYELENSALAKKLQEIISANKHKGINEICNKSASTQTDIEKEFDTKQIFKEMIDLPPPLSPISVASNETNEKVAGAPPARNSCAQTDKLNEDYAEYMDTPQLVELKYMGRGIKIIEDSQSGPFKIKTFTDESLSDTETNSKVKKSILFKKMYKNKFDKIIKIIKDNKLKITRVLNKNNVTNTALAGILSDLSKSQLHLFTQICNQIRSYSNPVRNCNTCKCCCSKSMYISKNQNCLEHNRSLCNSRVKYRRDSKYRRMRKKYVYRGRRSSTRSTFVTDTDDEDDDENMLTNQLVKTSSKLTENTVGKINKFGNYKEKDVASSISDKSSSLQILLSSIRNNSSKSNTEILTDTDISTDDDFDKNSIIEIRSKLIDNVEDNVDSNSHLIKTNKTTFEQPLVKMKKAIKVDSYKNKKIAPSKKEKGNVILTKYLESLNENSKRKRRRTVEDTDSGIDTISNVKSPPGMIEDVSNNDIEKSRESNEVQEEEHRVKKIDTNNTEETCLTDDSEKDLKLTKDVNIEEQSSKKHRKRKISSHVSSCGSLSSTKGSKTEEPSKKGCNGSKKLKKMFLSKEIITSDSESSSTVYLKSQESTKKASKKLENKVESEETVLSEPLENDVKNLSSFENERSSTSFSNSNNSESQKSLRKVPKKLKNKENSDEVVEPVSESSIQIDAANLFGSESDNTCANIKANETSKLIAKKSKNNEHSEENLQSVSESTMNYDAKYLFGSESDSSCSSRKSKHTSKRVSNNLKNKENTEETIKSISESEVKKDANYLFGAEADSSKENLKLKEISKKDSKKLKQKINSDTITSSLSEVIIKNDAKYDHQKLIETMAKNNSTAVNQLKDKIQLKDERSNESAKIFKKPEKSNIIPACPRSPDVVECVTNEPKIIPLEITKLSLKTAKKLVRNIATMDWDQELMTIVTDVLSREDTEYVAKIIVNQVAKDFSQEFDRSFTPPAPLMTKTQQKLLTLLCRLEKAGLVNIYECFIRLAEQRLLSESRIEVVHPLTRLYVAFCRIHYDVEQVRMLCCNAAYHMKDLLTPLMFVVLTMWAEVLPLASESDDIYLAIVLVQVIRLKTCRKPGYNLTNLNKLLTDYYGYPAGPKDNEAIISTLATAYAGTCSKIIYTAILILCKNMPDVWTYKQIRQHFVPLIDNNIQDNSKSYLVSTTLILTSRLLEHFDHTNFNKEVSSIRNWMLNILLQSENFAAEVKDSLSTCITMLTEVIPKD